jgi:uncharacterized protein YidB (DUF937 family)
MSILDNLTQMLGSQSGGETGAMGHVMALINNPETGGLQGLVQQFHSNGLGGVVNSWIGSGSNQPITAEQIQQVVGQDRLTAIAEKLGMQPDEASAKIAQFLPGMIDKLTPAGKVEQPG